MLIKEELTVDTGMTDTIHVFLLCVVILFSPVLQEKKQQSCSTWRLAPSCVVSGK